MEHTVIHDEKVDRFEVFESGQIAYLQYDEKNGVLDILHTIVPPQLEGQGIAQALTEAAVRYASVVGLKIRPTCSFAKMFFTRHTQYLIRFYLSYLYIYLITLFVGHNIQY